MGQYYYALTIDRNGEVSLFEPGKFDNMLKLMESSWIGNSFPNAVYSSILRHPQRVAWIGDYSDEGGPEGNPGVMPMDEFLEYFNTAWERMEQTSFKPCRRFNARNFSQRDLGLVDENTTGTYLVNHSKGVFLDMGKYISNSTVIEGSFAGCCANPLPLLTACGNGKGGGDFRESDRNVGFKDVGIWAFDTLEYVAERPEGLKEIMFMFLEAE